MAERITVVWHENAIRKAVERLHACLNTEDSAANDVHEINGKRVTSMDLWCLLDAGRAVLAEEPAPSSSDAPNRTEEAESELVPPGAWIDIVGAVGWDESSECWPQLVGAVEEAARQAIEQYKRSVGSVADSELRRQVQHTEAYRELEKVRGELERLRADSQAWQGHDCEARCTRAHVPPDGSPFGADAGQPDTCPHGDTNCKTVLGKTVLDKPYHGNCHPWHYRLRSRLNGVYGALAGQGNELAPKLRAAIGFLDESVGQPDTEATEQAPVPFCAEHVQVGKTIRVCGERVPDGFCPEHGDVGPPRAEQPVTPATPTGVAVVELDADDPLAQRVEHDSRMDGVDTPGCDCGHSGMGEGWHSSDCTWKQTPAAPTLRACSQDEGCTGISCDLPARHPDSHEGKATYEQAKYVGYQLTVIWPRMPYDKCKPPLTEVGDQAPGGES